MSEKKKWKQVGSIRQNDKGRKYIKLDDVSGLKDGVALQMEKPEDKLQRLHELGHLTEEQLEYRLSKVPEWLLYELVLPPQD